MLGLLMTIRTNWTVMADYLDLIFLTPNRYSRQAQLAHLNTLLFLAEDIFDKLVEFILRFIL